MNSPTIEQQIEEIQAKLTQILSLLTDPSKSREWFSVEEVATMFGKNPYTVREWCRLGRIYAGKRAERRGGAELWKIAAPEVARIKDEGLLPIDQRRNVRS